MVSIGSLIGRALGRLEPDEGERVELELRRLTGGRSVLRLVGPRQRFHSAEEKDQRRHLPLLSKTIRLILCAPSISYLNRPWGTKQVNDHWNPSWHLSLSSTYFVRIREWFGWCSRGRALSGWNHREDRMWRVLQTDSPWEKERIHASSVTKDESIPRFEFL